MIKISLGFRRLNYIRADPDVRNVTCCVVIISMPCLALPLTVLSLACRKKGLLLNNLLGVGGACLMGLSQMSNSFEMLIIGRLVIGINCGELLVGSVWGYSWSHKWGVTDCLCCTVEPLYSKLSQPRSIMLNWILCYIGSSLLTPYLPNFSILFSFSAKFLVKSLVTVTMGRELPRRLPPSRKCLIKLTSFR